MAPPSKCGSVLLLLLLPLSFIHTGPNRNVSEWKQCVDKSVRIGLTVHPDGRHVFDDSWVVSYMTLAWQGIVAAAADADVIKIQAATHRQHTSLLCVDVVLC